MVFLVVSTTTVAIVRAMKFGNYYRDVSVNFARRRVRGTRLSRPNADVKQRFIGVYYTGK
jgi:hypothetical protein